MAIVDYSSLTANKIKCRNCGQMIIHVSDREENIVGKGEIARHKQFLLLSVVGPPK